MSNSKKDGNIIIFHHKRDDRDAFDGHSFLERSRMELNEYGPITIKDYKNYYTLEEVKQLAENGNPSAQFVLGKYYYNFPNEPKDIKLAKEWLKKAADQGHLDAKCDLGYMLYASKNVKHDFKKAVSYLQEAAEQGHKNSQIILGNIYREGAGCIKKNSSLALKLYIEAATDDRIYQSLVSEMYESGEGSKVDYEKSFDWALKSALNGFTPCQCKIGNYYRLGLGVEKDFDKAYYWLIEAAKQKYVDAFCSIGMLYIIGGNSIKRDINRALKWFKRAISDYNDDDFATMICEYIKINSGKYVYDMKRFKKWLFEKAVSGDNSALEAVLSSYLWGFITPIDPKISKKLEKRLGHIIY